MTREEALADAQDAEGTHVRVGDNVIYGGTGMSPTLTRKTIIDIQPSPKYEYEILYIMDGRCRTTRDWTFIKI